MKLYHFTGLARLVGDGFEALKAALDEGEAADAVAYAAPESILRAGVQPYRNDDFDGALRTPLPACVWLTDDPEMPELYCSYHGWRLTIVIPSSDRRLTPWPKYFRKHSLEEARDCFSAISEEQQRASAGFFGRIMPDRIRAVDHHLVATALNARAPLQGRGGGERA